MISKFRRGSLVFACNVCGRKTRETGVQSVGNKICPQCYELAGLENEISDHYTTFAEVEGSIRSLVAEVEAKGGNVAEWNETFNLKAVR